MRYIYQVCREQYGIERIKFCSNLLYVYVYSKRATSFALTIHTYIELVAALLIINIHISIPFSAHFTLGSISIYITLNKCIFIYVYMYKDMHETLKQGKHTIPNIESVAYFLHRIESNGSFFK